MRIDIDGLEVAFPYPSMYKEQLQYVRELKKALDEGGHGLLEMPTGTFASSYRFDTFISKIST
jgi:DNA excision repair protein ERCC-2